MQTTHSKPSLSSANIENKERLFDTLHAFDLLNASDPNIVEYRETQFPYELFYALRLFRRVIALDPAASEALMLASRCQHLLRWKIPRDSYPEGREGYLKWRSDLKIFHADEAAKILDEYGYDEAMKQKVRSLNLKEDIKNNPNCQTLEDALCIIFLTHQLNDFIEKHPEEKVLNTLKKTATKMSPQALTAAADIAYCDTAKAMFEKALS